MGSPGSAPECGPIKGGKSKTCPVQKQSESRREIARETRPLRSRVQGRFITKARKSIDANDLDSAEEAVRDAVVALDKAAQKGALHPNNAARRKSRIMRQLHQAKNSAEPGQG